MKTKSCSKCGEEKELSEFHKDKYTSDKHRSNCKDCANKGKKHYYELNIEKINKKYKIYYNINKEKINQNVKNKRKIEPWLFSFYDIKKRCENPNSQRYHRYGGRGIECRITVDELKFLWFRDKAWELKYPCVDRIDNDGHYEVDNCRWIEKSVNSKKDKNKPILQYDLDGNFIREWESITKASKEYGTTINDCLRGRTKTSKGFIWKYKNERRTIK